MGKFRNKYAAIAVLLGAISIMLGALGSHALKGVLTPDELTSFEVGVKYQMYNALFLLIYSLYADYTKKAYRRIFYLITTGTLMFSFSIYLLVIDIPLLGVSLSPLGPITPLGGILMIGGWLWVAVIFLTSKNK